MNGFGLLQGGKLVDYFCIHIYIYCLIFFDETATIEITYNFDEASIHSTLTQIRNNFNTLVSIHRKH